MFTQFGATAESLSKASTMVFRIGTDAHLYDDPDDVNIAPLLDSKFDSEKCEALKRLLALIAQGYDVSNFFPQVVKNVASQSLEVKKLVYLYLLHYAEKRPNEALLSINYFQKDLGDPNPLVRAWALRTMAGIRLHDIAPIVLVAVSKAARDPSVYVRKCAANSLPKLHDLHLEENTASIEELVGVLLNDNSPGVIGAAAAAFASVCPSNLSLIGRNYRRLCETLPDVEEWGQIILIGILLRYATAKHGLVKESIMAPSHSDDKDASGNEGSDTYFGIKENTTESSSGLFRTELADIISRSYLEGSDKYLSRSALANGVSGLDGLHFTSAKDNDDIKILLQCTSPLLWSNNSAVVLAAAGVHWIMAPREDIKRIVKPLLFLLRSSKSSKYVVLCNIQVFAKGMPSLFAPHFEDFYISTSDSYQTKVLKLEILSSIATDSSISFIFQEFQDYVRDSDRKFTADTVAAIGSCAHQFPKVADTCLEGLLALTSPELSKGDVPAMNEEDMVLIQAIQSIKVIIIKDPSNHEKVIAHLIRNLDTIRVPAARAMVIWMVGEYSERGHIIPKVLPTVLKYLARCFISEETETKLQILSASTKVILHAKEEDFWEFRKILYYLLDLAKCDLNYDVRDRSRLVKELLSSYMGSCNLEERKFQIENKDLPRVVSEFIFGGHVKAPPPFEPFSARFYLPGSLSHIVLHAAPGYEPLPRPCSLNSEDSGFGSNIKEFEVSGDGAIKSESYETDDSGSVSGSLNEESGSDYSSDDSVGSDVTGGSASSGLVDKLNSQPVPLIHLSDNGNPEKYQNCASGENNAHSVSNDFGELLSGKSLESWLDESPSSRPNVSESSCISSSSARISIGDIGGRVKPKLYSLLDPTNGNGLTVDYIFSSEASSISPLLVCLQVSFKNYSAELMSNIQLGEEDSNKIQDSSDQALAMPESSSHVHVPTLVPMEEITNLEPGETTKRVVHVHFNHHLLPLKLVIWCNGKKHPVKLRPDIGYFVKPLKMDIDAFTSKEAQLPGMFECTRRCIFIDHIGEAKKGGNSKDQYLVICEALVLKMLSNANLHLMSVDMPVSANLDDASGLCIRFSSEILSNSVPCLITLALEGTCFEPLNVTVKINCEETVFGLNLLNRIVNFLGEPDR